MTSIAEIKEHNERAGYFFFSPGTVRFFRSRVLEDVYYDRFFITSEKDFSGNRTYGVREYMPETGQVETVRRRLPDADRLYTPVGRFSSKSQAVEYIRNQLGPRIEFRLVSIDAWRDDEGCWNWNGVYQIEGEIYFLDDPKEFTPRKILRFLRDARLLPAPPGTVTIDMHHEHMDGYLFEVLDKNTLEPLMALESVRFIPADQGWKTFELKLEEVK